MNFKRQTGDIISTEKLKKNVKKEFRAPRGTQDYLPGNAARLHYLDTEAGALFERYGYRRIITPIFEDTDLFKRSIGESSDIVRKEMYTFTDRGDRSLTLRPEATAPVVRAFIEHNLQAEIQPVKLFYMGTMYRYERPQAGRYREFWQLGLEALGAGGPLIDAEVIVVLMEYLSSLGLKDLQLHVGSMGDDNCRAPYTEKLRESLAPKAEAMCGDCQERLLINPLRVFDCKNKRCIAILAEAPKITDNLCDECRDHLEKVETLITAAGLEYHLDSTLVRGFDYYTRTTFEVRSSLLGAQNALGGGGRYDDLVAQYGGPPTPAVGFALGVERILMALKAQEVDLLIDTKPDVFVAVVEDAGRDAAFELICKLRRGGLAADMDFTGRGLKAQMKLANKLGANFTIILGPDELGRGEAVVRDMAAASEETVVIGSLKDYLLKNKR